MVELLGSGYVIEHCISAFSKEQEHKSYQIYITDALKAISENTGGVETKHSMSKRWIDIIEPVKEKEPKETRSANEIITDFKKRLNRKKVTE